ncbi:MAG: transporter, family, 3-phenylpropionic acid transporter, partial [Alphaproteobacteria bacterium]|nr:transporter, family, 3-phenylpropionic acid transporter [Alphaproteobacteria bacterium]
MAAAPQFSTDRFALKLGLFYAAYFFFGGVQLPFFPLWLEARG